MAKPPIKKFVIKVGDMYYMTTGKLLTYDMANAQTPAQKKGVEEMAKLYKEEHDKPHTYYEAVRFDDVSFSGVNTGQVP